MPSPVYIVVLNYRGADDTIGCLQSLSGLDYPDFKFIVVDNASGDGSVERLRAFQTGFSKGFTLIESPENTGYSGGNNLGIRHVLSQPDADSSYIWILNNDTTVAPDALTHQIKTTQQYPKSIVGPLITYPDGTFQQVGIKIGWLTGSTKGYPESSVKDGMGVDAISGASMLIAADMLRHVGLLDERYFLYCEDVEFCLRAARHGYTCRVATRARVFHAEGASTGKAGAKASLRTQYYYQRNRLAVLLRYAPFPLNASIYLYSLFRLARTVVKSWLGQNPDRKASARVHCLAFTDFQKGISGPCPHAL